MADQQQQPTTPVRVLIVDDHALFRRGLETALAESDAVVLVGQAVDGEQGVEMSLERRPDVVLMDVRMPGMGGIEALRRIKSEAPGIRVLMLTISDEEQDLYESVKAGASGYLLKEIAVEEVPAAVVSVHRGLSLVSPALVGKLLDEFAALARAGEERERRVEPRLTQRETEILRFVARGMANRDIARRLYISENTVKNHVRNILEKLRLHSRTEAVVYALRENLLELDDV